LCWWRTRDGKKDRLWEVREVVATKLFTEKVAEDELTAADNIFYL
jgi:hypothetical protein